MLGFSTAKRRGTVPVHVIIQIGESVEVLPPVPSDDLPNLGSKDQVFP